MLEAALMSLNLRLWNRQ